MNFIKRAWRGEEKLWKVFWGGILFPQLIGFGVGIVEGAMLGAQGRSGYVHSPEFRAHLITSQWWWYVLMLIYYILLEITLWKSVANTAHKIWGYLANGVVIILILAGFGILLGKFSAPLSVSSTVIASPSTASAVLIPPSDSMQSLATTVFTQFSKCWTVPKEAINAEDTVVLHVKLLNDGTVLTVTLADDNGRYNSDASFRAVADSAIRAVQSCSPLKNMPIDRFKDWEDMELTFDPKSMLL